MDSKRIENQNLGLAEGCFEVFGLEGFRLEIGLSEVIRRLSGSNFHIFQKTRLSFYINDR